MEQSGGKAVLPFIKKHALVLTLLLVLALQFVPNPNGAFPWGGMWMRMQVKELPVAESAAKASVENFLNDQALAIARQQYPNLPESNLQKVVNDIKKTFREENLADLEREEKKLEQQIRNHYTYDVGDRKFGYMPDIDPYFYLRYARNIVEKGHWYDIMRNGRPWDNHMVAPIGTYADPNWHPYILSSLYNVFSIFNKQITLMHAATYFPIVFIFLSLILAFLIASKVSGKLGGFFAVTALALLPAVMGRTPWGHADTDAYNVFFPLLVVWFLFIAFSAVSSRKQLIYAGLAGISIAIFSNLWTGWWYLFDFVLGALVITIGIEFIRNFRNLKESRLKKFVSVGASFFLLALIVCGFTIGFGKFLNDAFRGAITFTAIKEAALPSLWPNVFTTVAELNPASFNDVLLSVGGTLMFLIAALGILLLLLKKDEHGKFDVTYSALLAIWFIGTIYASLKGLRFTLLLGPAFAVAFGAGAGLLYQRLSRYGETHLHIRSMITGVILIVVLGLVIINPVKGTHMVESSYRSVINDVPIVNDAWWNSLTKIREESAENAIINSWWDFGHHFKYIADRAVTFDGSTQNSPMAHWVGRVLQTDNEEEAIAILRMLDCGSNLAYKAALNVTEDPLVSVQLVKTMIMQDKETAMQTAQEAGVSADITKYTHCEPPEDYFITSADMVGKAGVWAHFGLWNFEKAETWKKWRKLGQDEAVAGMVERFGVSEEQATEWHQEANAIGTEDEANAWISPWPGYVTTSPRSCTRTNNLVECGGITLNTEDMSAEVSIRQGVAKVGKIVMYDEDGSKEVVTQKGNEDLAVVFWPSSSGVMALAANTELADSMFTRLFYMQGLGLKHFKPFTEERQLIGGMIYVWKVDWQGSEVLIPEALQPKEAVEPGARVALNYIGWTDEGVFDSSIVDWQNKNVSQLSSFDDFETRPLPFEAGKGMVIPGFETRIQGMKAGEERTITVPPEEAYGTDPEKHELGGKTLHFKIRIEAIR